MREKAPRRRKSDGPTQTAHSRQTYLDHFGFTPASQLRFDDLDREDDVDHQEADQ